MGRKSYSFVFFFEVYKKKLEKLSVKKTLKWFTRFYLFKTATCNTAISKAYAKVLKYFVVDSDEEAMRQAVDEYG